MAQRTLYLVRHGAADALGQVTADGREQARLLGRRLAGAPVDAVWHSPLPRAVDSARIIAAEMPRVLVDEAAELVDNVPFVPGPEDVPPSWKGFFDGYDRGEADAGRRTADASTARFCGPNGPGRRATHEVVVTHAYPIAWIVREVLNAPPAQWMSLAGVANASLTVVEFSDDGPPAVVMFNDMSHLPAGLRWTGFAGGGRP
ncbi:histidine phosphatase family protein [Nocardiopsis changdeensis]|uniref:histidine phosphatase family protein n=1 Tax=Nocardiopsis changdeensis TaxID=2831969 RepID=UPI003F479816